MALPLLAAAAGAAARWVLTRAFTGAVANTAAGALMGNTTANAGIPPQEPQNSCPAQGPHGGPIF